MGHLADAGPRPRRYAGGAVHPSPFHQEATMLIWDLFRRIILY
jgi:hypothetical protein